MRRESDTLRPGDRAPKFTLQDAGGRSYTLEQLVSEAQRYLLLVFDRGTW